MYVRARARVSACLCACVCVRVCVCVCACKVEKRMDRFLGSVGTLACPSSGWEADQHVCPRNRHIIDEYADHIHTCKKRKVSPKDAHLYNTGADLLRRGPGHCLHIPVVVKRNRKTLRSLDDV